MICSMGALTVIGLLLGIVAAVIQVLQLLTDRPSRVLQGVTLVLLVVAGFAVFDSGRARAELDLRRDMQERAKELTAEWSGSSGKLDSEYMSEGDFRGITLGTIGFFESFKACRPATLQEARNVMNDARARADAARERVKDECDYTDYEREAWAEAGEASFGLVASVAVVTPVCDDA